MHLCTELPLRQVKLGENQWASRHFCESNHESSQVSKLFPHQDSKAKGVVGALGNVVQDQLQMKCLLLCLESCNVRDKPLYTDCTFWPGTFHVGQLGHETVVRRCESKSSVFSFNCFLSPSLHERANIIGYSLSTHHRKSLRFCVECLSGC